MLKEIRKVHGEGALFDMGERVGIHIPSIPTGLFNVDYEVLGIGGFPRGRIIEVYGPESSGKTTLALHLIGQAQKAGELAAFIDAEHALDPNWATINGVNVDALLVSQPDNGEQALDIAERLVASGAFGVIVVDSVAALTPKAEIEGEMGDSHMGLQARLMSQAMRKLNSQVSRSGTILLFINQLRDKIGVMFGSPETTTGGKALKFYASVRLDIRKLALIKDGDIPVGNKVKIKAAKNKCSAPFRETEVELMYGSGFDTMGTLFDAAVKLEVVKRSGAWYSYAEERFQGKDSAVSALRDRQQEILGKVLEARNT